MAVHIAVGVEVRSMLVARKRWARKRKSSTLPLQCGRQVAEGVDFKLIEAITVLNQLAIERV
jgi:hypothetical protein